MRTVIAILALCLCSVALAEAPRYALDVKGLACPFCAYGIEKHLNKLEGVGKVEVDIENGRVLVTMEDEAALTRDRAARAVDKAGFTLHGFERVGDANGSKDDGG